MLDEQLDNTTVSKFIYLPDYPTISLDNDDDGIYWTVSMIVIWCSLYNKLLIIHFNGIYSSADDNVTTTKSFGVKENEKDLISKEKVKIFRPNCRLTLQLELGKYISHFISFKIRNSILIQVITIIQFCIGS